MDIDKLLYEEARSDFEKARNKAFFNELVNKLFKKNNELFRFDEVKYLLAPHGMVYRGIQAIPIDKIIGSEGRYDDFDKDFMPKKDNTRDRWENIDVLKKKDINLPPISVYKLGDFYFVKDGNHRVSVAKELKQDFIDAEVVELFINVPLGNDKLTEKDLLLAEGYRYFSEKTNINKIIPNNKIILTHPWGYYRLVEHIQTYKYFLGEKEHREFSPQEALIRWYNELYLPVIKLIRKRKILDRFPDRTESDLYIWLMDHWHFLKEKYGNIELEKAMDDYLKKFGENIFLKIKNFFKKLFG